MNEKRETSKPLPKSKPRTLHVHPLRGKHGFEVRLEDDSTVLLRAHRPRAGFFESVPNLCFYGKSETKPDTASGQEAEVQDTKQTGRSPSKTNASKGKEEEEMDEIGSYSTRSFSSKHDLQVQGQQWTLQNIAWFVADYRLKCAEGGIEWSWQYTGAFPSDMELRDENGKKLAQFVHDRGWFSRKKGILEIWMDRVGHRGLNDAIILSAISFLEMDAERARRDQQSQMPNPPPVVVDVAPPPP